MSAVGRPNIRVVRACRRSHEDLVGSLCTKSSNNNNGGFSGFLKVGVGEVFLKFSRGKDPFLPHVHARCGPVGDV